MLSASEVLTNAIQVIAAERRKVCQNVRNAKGEVSEMYWEGVRSGLEYAQNYLENLREIKP